MYASLGGGVFNANGIKCQNDRYLMPPPGWEIAPYDADSMAVTGAYPWETHVNVMSNGCGYGTKTAGGAPFGCNWLEQSGNTYKTKGCYMMILIRKPIPNPTMSPTHVPTEKPSDHPTFHPTLEPTHVPTEKPSFRPTHEPTLEPTKNPTFEPSAHPSKEPTPEPTKEPTHEPSLHPTERPSLEPTLFPTYKSTNYPTSKPTTPFPTFHPTLEPVEKNNMCTFEFVKGKSSLEVSSGCALISVDSIDYMKDGESTHAAYVCATSKKPTKLNDVTNGELGIKENMSSIIPGDGCEVTMFSEDNSRGMRKTYTSNFHPTLVHFHFFESNVGNDGIVSMLVESVFDSFELPAECHQGREVA
jgi:hypothetical protein